MHPQFHYLVSLSTSLGLLSTGFSGGPDQGYFLLPAPRAQEAVISYPWTPDPRKGQHFVFPCSIPDRTLGAVTGRTPRWSGLPETSWLLSHPPHSDLPSPFKLSGSKLSVGILARNLHNPFFYLLPRPPHLLPPCQGPKYLHSPEGFSCFHNSLSLALKSILLAQRF